MFTTPKKSGLQIPKKSRRKAMIQEELDAQKLTIACTSNANRAFGFNEPIVSVEDVQGAIVLIAINTFRIQKY